MFVHCCQETEHFHLSSVLIDCHVHLVKGFYLKRDIFILMLIKCFKNSLKNAFKRQEGF